MILFLLSMALALSQTVTPRASEATPRQAVAATVEAETSAKLLNVKRIYVDESFGDDASSKQLQAMIVNALAASKRFTITENKDKSDAILKGTTGQHIHQEAHTSSESTGVKSRSTSMDISESSHSTETIDEVTIAVRLVSSDGDVIWATTKESKGAKYKGPSADVADQVVKQLLSDLDRLQSAPKDTGTSK